MLSMLKTGKKLVGIKQSKAAIKDDKAAWCFVAMDADPKVILPVISLCEQTQCRLVKVDTKNELGLACGIEVGASAAVILK